MIFTDALMLLRDGKTMRRAGWPDWIRSLRLRDGQPVWDLDDATLKRESETPSGWKFPPFSGPSSPTWEDTVSTDWMEATGKL